VDIIWIYLYPLLYPDSPLLVMNSTTVSKRIYVRVWMALMLLLLATWGLAKDRSWTVHTVAALTISISKMLLVVLFFMHGRYEKPVTWIFITAALIWFLIMVDLTLSDYLTRGVVPGSSGR